MAYKMQDTNWKFTAPQAGEVDSVEAKANTLQEIDDALIDPGHRAQLEGRGEKLDVTQDSGEFPDETYTYDEYQDAYVTNLHKHPTPNSVPEADHAKESDHSLEADHANKASQLEPGANINGHLFNGTEDITLTIDDIPDASRVFYGTVKPEQYGGFPTELRNGDLYVEYTE